LKIGVVIVTLPEYTMTSQDIATSIRMAYTMIATGQKRCTISKLIAAVHRIAKYSNNFLSILIVDQTGT